MLRVIRVAEGSNDDITFVVTNEQGVYDLSTVDHVVLVLIDRYGTTVQFSTSDQNPKLVITGAPQGRISFTPEQTTFSREKSPYKAFLWIYTTPSARVRVPNDREWIFEAVPSYGT